MTDLVEFLRARLDEDEQAARAARGDFWEVGPTFGARDNRVYVRREGDLIDSVGTCVIAGQVSNVPEFRANAEHIARWDPARVLAEVEAKRRILEETANGAACLHAPEILRLLALPYAGHPDDDPSWAVTTDASTG